MTEGRPEDFRHDFICEEIEYLDSREVSEHRRARRRSGRRQPRITVWRDRKTTVRTGDDHRVVEQGSRNHSIAMDDALTVKGGDHTVKVEAGSHTLDAAVSITLKVGANSITIDQNGISLKGLQVNIDGDTSVKLKALQVQVDATASLAMSALCAEVDGKASLSLKAALVQIN